MNDQAFEGLIVLALLAGPPLVAWLACRAADEARDGGPGPRLWEPPEDEG